MRATLHRSDGIVGNRVCITHDPTVLLLKDHIFCPVGGAPDTVPGVYDYGRRLVPQSWYFLGPDPRDHAPPIMASFKYEAIVEEAEDDTYLYVGWLHNAFGHFFVSTLSRLWQASSLPYCKVIVFAGADFRSETRKEHVAALLSAFGIDPARCVQFTRPTRIRNLILPYPSVEERSFAHRAAARAYGRAGDVLHAQARKDFPGSGPIYLSKSRLKHAVRKVVNEEAIEQVLEQHGYTIIYPETLNMPDQVALWRAGRPVVAFNGSGLHTSAMTPGVRLVSLGWDRWIDSTFLNLDEASGTRADYYFFDPVDLRSIGPSEHVTECLVATDPIAAAEAIMRVVDAV